MALIVQDAKQDKCCEECKGNIVNGVWLSREIAKKGGSLTLEDDKLCIKVGKKEKCWEYCVIESDVDKKFRRLPCIKKVTLEYKGVKREKCVMYDTGAVGTGVNVDGKNFLDLVVPGKELSKAAKDGDIKLVGGKVQDQLVGYLLGKDNVKFTIPDVDFSDEIPIGSEVNGVAQAAKERKEKEKKKR